jgi:signal transduction histidine kinase/ActR/RegA family two-component response regulator
VAGEKILIIDLDTGLLETVAKQVLSPHGFRPLFARGQDEGLKVAEDESPHLLLLHLPMDSSLRLLRRLAQADHLIPSILLVERESDYVAVEFLRLGVRDYLVYPFATEDVLPAVRRALGQEACSPDYRQVAGDLAVFNRELEQRVKEFSVLLGIGRSVNSLLDLDLVLNRVTEAAVFITGAEEGYLLLLDSETGELRLRAAQNLGEVQAQGFSLRVEDSMAGMAVSSGKPILLSGDGTQNLKVKTGYLVKSLLNVPLKANGRVIGVLGVDNQVSKAGFTLTHLRRLSALADVAATAVENARQYTELHQKLTRRVKEVATLQAVAGQLSGVTDFDVGARLALSLALRATNAEAGVLAWAVGEQNHPTFYVSQGSLGELVLTHHNGATPERWWDEQTLQAVIEMGQPILKDDLGVEGNGHNTHARSRMAVPMRRGKRVIGAIDLESSLPHAFTQDDLQFVISVADQVAIALEGTVLQERAQTERERLSLLMEAVDNAVWLVDADLRLLAQNEVASDMLGWPLSETMSRSVYELVPSGDTSPEGAYGAANNLCQVLSQAMEERRRISFPQGELADDGMLLATRDGRPVLVRGQVLPVVREGRAVGAVCAFRQVRPEKADERIRFEFANMASHLLRSPLSFIQASIDLMLSSEFEVEEQRAMLNKMREQSQRIAEFVKDLLEISRMETGKVRVYAEPVVLVPLIERVLDLIRTEETRYVLSFNAPDTFPIVVADTSKTELILLSFLRSAMNRYPNGGHITLELQARTSEAIISITDDGEVIPLKQLDRIFSQFYPVDDDGDKMPSTYRLGLYTTRRLVELQNGRVWAESQPGKGTRLSFSLPVWGVSQ